MNIRLAEKNRVSTCSLADAVAHAVIAEYRSLSIAEMVSQSVLAGIVVLKHSHMEVVTIATGNKFSEQCDEGTVNDCHAEILVRRAFKFWLLNEWDKKSASKYFDEQMGILSGVKFILYISSAPCGSACIRRWAKTEKEVFNSTSSIPIDIHEAYYPHSKHEGQSAITYKGDSKILSCSDKILKWSVLGLQGTRLSSLGIIKLDGIVIGRKFVKKHAMRAFCCRLSTKSTPLIIRNALHHPSLMCTSVKFDDGTFVDGNGATFSNISIWASCGVVETLDGCTGRILSDGTCSKLSTLKLNETIIACKIPPFTNAHAELAKALQIELHRL